MWLSDIKEIYFLIFWFGSFRPILIFLAVFMSRIIQAACPKYSRPKSENPGWNQLWQRSPWDGLFLTGFTGWFISKFKASFSALFRPLSCWQDWPGSFNTHQWSFSRSSVWKIACNQFPPILHHPGLYTRSIDSWGFYRWWHENLYYVHRGWIYVSMWGFVIW